MTEVHRHPLVRRDEEGSARILGVRIDATSYAAATAAILAWARAGQSRTVVAANVHVVMEARDHPPFGAVLAGTDLVTSDGVPLVWMLRRLGFPDQQRVYGPNLTIEVCAAAARDAIPIGLYGGTADLLRVLREKLLARFPGLSIAYQHAPPFRPLTAEEDRAVVDAVHQSGARILFVGLGCPKQEQWVADHRGQLRAVMLAVGAAFDFHAGKLRQAPPWLQRLGLEWLFRLMMEPRRLWRRYLHHNPRFAVLALRQLLRRPR